MPNMSKVKFHELLNEHYRNGVTAGISKGRHMAEEEMKSQLAKAKLEQLQAVTTLIAENTKAMSRAGYLISQLSDKKGW